MSIASRIQSIEEHIKESYQELEGIGIDTTGVDKNLENIPKLIDGYWETLPKVTEEGTSITLDNTKEGKMKINLKGNTSQETTTGANLVDFLNPTGLYNITYDTTTQIYTTNAITGSWGGFHIYNSNTTVEIPVGTSKYYYSADIRLKSGTYSNSLNYFRAGGTLANVERTSVGIANPNMTSSFQRYIFEVTYVNSGDTATSSADHIAQLKTGADNCVLEIKNVMISTTNTTYEPYTNGPAPNPSYPEQVHIVTGNNSITISNSDNTQSKTYPINLGNIELCKIGTYQDYIYKDSDKWYLHKEIGKIVLNGSEYWAKSSKTQVNRYYVVNIFNTILNANSIDLISNYFICITPSSSDSNQIGLAKFNKDGVMNNISLSNTDLDTLEKYKTWLSTHNTEVYYVLATPTYTEITDSTLLSQLEALNGAKSYTTQTNINQDNNDNASILNASALSE